MVISFALFIQCRSRNHDKLLIFVTIGTSDCVISSFNNYVQVVCTPSAFPDESVQPLVMILIELLMIVMVLVMVMVMVMVMRRLKFAKIYSLFESSIISRW